MNGIPTPGGFRRILVALDASRESDAALAAAAELAQQLDAELMGLFIEDIDLLNLAALPFSREVAVLSLSGRGLDPERVARELRSKAAAARRALAALAEEHHLQWSFRIARGHVDAELLTASREADLVAVGKGTRPLSGKARLGSTGRAMVIQATRSVLLAAGIGGPADAPVAIVYEGSGDSAALALAARLAESDRRHLVVFVLGDSQPSFAQREVSIRQQLRALGVSAAILRLQTSDAAGLLYALQSRPLSLLILDAIPKLLSDVTLDLLVEKCSCSLLLLRDWTLDRRGSTGKQEGIDAA